MVKQSWYLRNTIRTFLHATRGAEEIGIGFAHELVQPVIKRELERLFHGLLKEIPRSGNRVRAVLVRQRDVRSRVLLVHGTGYPGRWYWERKVSVLSLAYGCTS